MIEFEYKLVDLTIYASGDHLEPWLKEGKKRQDQLNALGEKGWEFICFQYGFAFLKRIKQPTI